MASSTLRALAMALLLSAGIGATAVTLSVSTVEAAGVRPAVGKALQEAIRDAASGNGGAASAKIREAESVGGLTSSEQQAIEQTKQYVAAKTGSGGGATGCRAKFANDYNAGRYSSVVGSDADCLRSSGALTGEDEVVVAQAYYLMHDFESCIRHVRGLGRAGQQTLELLNRCAYEAHDTEAQQSALEQLVVDYNQPKYWSDLLDSADRVSGLNNDDLLDIYRLRLLTGTMKAEPDYETATEIAIQLGFPTEAVTFAQKGVDAKSNRGARLIGMARTQAASDVAGLAKLTAAASAAKTGDASVKLGEDYWGMGRYQDAVAAIKAGIAKGVANADEAQIRLAMAYIGLHDRDAAVHALAQVSKSAPAHTLAVSHLWSVYARTH
jgi:tetratricopeptide (TPR) repeat protein